MKNETIVLFFTAEEVECLKDALNTYSLEMMEKSQTWGKVDSWGREDVWHIIASKAGRIWTRFYDASLELAEKESAK